MNALPIKPTERDRERFRDITKAKNLCLEYDRTLDGKYKRERTTQMFEMWWSVERERQLLQNLNMSQGCKLSEMGARLEKAEEALRSLASFVGAGGYNADKVDAGVFEQKIRWGIGQITERLEKAQMEIDALSTENGFVHQHAEEDKKELREQLEAERKRLDWALNHVAEYTNGLLYWISDVYSKHAKMATNPRVTIDELIAGEQK